MCLLNLVFSETAISNQRFHDHDPLLAKCETPFYSFTHVMWPRIDITNVHVGLWSSSHSSVACVCRITNLLLLVTGSTSLQAWACSCQVRGRANTENIIIKKCTNKPVKRFEMKSNGCRDVQHTGLQSTQTRRNAGKQGAQTRGTRHIFPIIPISASGCMIIVGYVNQFKVTTNWKKLLGY